MNVPKDLNGRDPGGDGVVLHLPTAFGPEKAILSPLWEDIARVIADANRRARTQRRRPTALPPSDRPAA